jgi:UDP-N-acetylmuramate dehydrogenase
MKEGMAIEPQATDELRRLLGKRVRFDETMSKHTSLRVGGPADAMARPSTREEVVALLDLCRSRELRVCILGGGFNTIVPDSGISAVVLRLLDLHAIDQQGDGIVAAEAGATHSSVMRFCADRGLSGLEFAVGIPGTVGGWVAMNAGIGTREMKDVVASLESIDLSTGEHRVTNAEELRFGYRALEAPGDVVLVGARFHTTPADPQEIREHMKSLMSERRKKQPVDKLSCGSVFKNPPGDYAGRLIQAAGLKGLRCGGAEISSLHANFIVNLGGATASDVFHLIDRAREEVARQFNLELEPEVQVLGEGL